MTPVTAAAAAEYGLIRWTMPPFPIRPLKLRLVVDAQTSPSASTPELIPRQAPQVGFNTQKPASMKILIIPSVSAILYTKGVAGVTIPRTPAASVRSFRIVAAVKKKTLSEEYM